MVVQSPSPSSFRRLVTAVSVGVPLLILLAVATSAASAAEGEDTTDPAVMKRNIISMSDRAISLGAALGFPQETQKRLLDIRHQLALVGDQEYAKVSDRLGPDAARASQTLDRIVVAQTGGVDPSPFGLAAADTARAMDSLGQAAADGVPGHWSYDPNDVRVAATPNLTFKVDEQPSGSGSTNTSAKVCSNNSTQSCKADADCGQGNSCIDRPTTSSGSQPLSISSDCREPPTDENIKNLLIAATVVEGVAMVMNRVCGQEFFGFNISLVCIVSDLAFLVTRSLYDFENLCANRWAGAEAHSVYNRTGALHDDMLDTQGAIASFRADTENQFNSLSSSMSSQFTAAANQLTNVDNHLTSVDTHVASQFTALDTHLVNLVGQLSNQLGNGTALLNADLRQVMKLLLTPDGRRQIVPAILTCDGLNCPNVLANCAAAGCSWNNVGPLP